jgi:hypothetical protein
MQTLALGGALGIGNGEHLHRVPATMSISHAWTTLCHFV